MDQPVDFMSFVTLPCCGPTPTGPTSTAPTTYPMVGTEFRDYFEGKRIHCFKCNSDTDWWSIALHNMSERGFNVFTVPALLGARRSHLQKEIRLHEMLAVDLTEAAVPPDATILEVAYSPTSPNAEDGVFPIEIHGNRPSRRHSHKYKIYPRPIKEGTNPNPALATQLTILVTWIRPSEDTEAWLHLTTAFKEHLYGESIAEGSIIPANVAVEMTLSMLMTPFIRTFCSSEKDTEEFLDKGATYSYQLKILLPILCDFYDLPRMNKDIRGSLNRLRGLRNQLGHDGILKQLLTRQEVARVLTGALFGFHFIRYIRGKLPPMKPYVE